MNSIISQMYEEAPQERKKMLEDYVTDEYISRRLTADEIVKIRDIIAAAAGSKGLDDLAKALEMPEDYLVEVFKIPAEVSANMNVNGVPEHVKKLIVCAVVPELIDEGRCHTCQGCGEFFFSENPREVMCPECRHNIGDWLLSHYVSFKLLDFEAETEAEDYETESEADS